MNLFSFFTRRNNSAPVARERLQILLAHERVTVGQSDLVDKLREEILAVIAKHVAIDRDKVHVKMNQGDAVSTLAVDIELPTPLGAGGKTESGEDSDGENSAKEDKAEQLESLKAS